LLLEAFYIKKFTPKYNAKLTDDKSYPLIKITINDDYPKILFARRSNDKSAIYFGPFPSSNSVKTVLKLIRRAFPYQSVLNHPKKICLYNHLGLCPCPPVFDSPDLKKEYKKNIKNITKILEGETKSIIRQLEKERDEKSQHLFFEEAEQIQSKITALNYITQPFRSPIEYEENPNLRSDIRMRELNSLKEILNTHGYHIGRLNRIECYDISNIQGKFATGSQIVFSNGEKNSNQYRKYKINKKDTPDDFAMHEEVMERRLKHSEWDMPDLIIIDGGKGQVSKIKSVLLKLNKNIPLIGLAKREETIVTDELKEIKIEKNSPALLLLMRMRDESHRFAITYHRHLRSKGSLKNT